MQAQPRCRNCGGTMHSHTTGGKSVVAACVGWQARPGGDERLEAELRARYVALGRQRSPWDWR